MKRSRLNAILLSAGLALLMIGCQGGSDDSEPEPGTPDPNASMASPTGVSPTGGGGGKSTAAGGGATTVSYTKVQEVLTKNCAGCHGEGGKEGIDLRSYASIMKGGNDGAVVKPGDAKASELVQVLTGAEGHPKMPPSGPLDAGDVKLIEDWINAGAKEG